MASIHLCPISMKRSRTLLACRCSEVQTKRFAMKPLALLLACALCVVKVQADFVYRDFNETDGIHVRL
jgi:hypothetical protein